MKNRIGLVIAILLIGSMVLSACGSGPVISSWPGITSSGDSLYVAYNSHVMNIRPNDGSILWQFPAEAESGRTYFSAPLVADSQVVIGDYLGALHSLDRATGTEKWQFNQTSSRWIGSPQVSAETILAPSSDHTLYALGMDGSLKWKFTANHALWAQPVSDGRAVFVPSMDHNLYALDIVDGKKLWQTDLGASLISSPAMDENGILYTGSLTNEVFALDSSNGKVVWRYKTGASVWGTPALKDGAVYFGDLNGSIYGLNGKDGSVIWKYDKNAPIIAGPTVFSDGLVFVTETGNVTACDFKGGELWSKPAAGKLYGPAVVSGERIIVGLTESENNKFLKAYDFKGSELWSLDVPK